jgi:hypothetical protein
MSFLRVAIDGPGDIGNPPIWADAELQPNNAAVVTSINRRLMTGSPRLAAQQTDLVIHPDTT